jgi:hypothetical protein
MNEAPLQKKEVSWWTTGQTTGQAQPNPAESNQIKLKKIEWKEDKLDSASGIVFGGGSFLCFLGVHTHTHTLC